MTGCTFCHLPRGWHYILNGIMGGCVADALGVPVEFQNRETLRGNPVINMRSYGTHNQKAGTWSDDTSMTLCLLDSLSKGLDYKDIMDKFLKWINDAEYTAHGEVFDVGNATRKALRRFEDGESPLNCGGLSENDNGNGSLMRILPILFYIKANYGAEFTQSDEAMNIIHQVSALTHGHKRSLIACGIYISVASMLLEGRDLSEAVEMGIYNAMEYYERHDEFQVELHNYNRLNDKSFAEIPINNIKSSGYVVDTIEAAIWCLLNTKSYKDCALLAVNLGEDTDTVAAVAGGLAGLYYGYDDIPKEWLSVIAKREYIEGLCKELGIALGKEEAQKLCSYIPHFETATKDRVCKWGGGEMLAEKNENIKTAHEILKRVSKNKEARMAYEARQAEIMDQLTRENSARKEGMQEGIEKVAKSLLDVLDYETISAKTGLSVEFVKGLRK
ncbi:ADP-ribosylglycohydrolase family protein [Clostridium sp. CS001]|uniref:ADP-ribosylglycohydrolase family protein n=1 Tax=Clostridium sp. CS001 TaxID=2880648 RepID=UPI00299D8E50|nr:ADP-ribosylglycohydrolase family protein [Clostridium sp. CS001]